MCYIGQKKVQNRTKGGQKTDKKGHLLGHIPCFFWKMCQNISNTIIG